LGRDFHECFEMVGRGGKGFRRKGKKRKKRKLISNITTKGEQSVEKIKGEEEKGRGPSRFALREGRGGMKKKRRSIFIFALCEEKKGRKNRAARGEKRKRKVALRLNVAEGERKRRTVTSSTLMEKWKQKLHFQEEGRREKLILFPSFR